MVLLLHRRPVALSSAVVVYNVTQVSFRQRLCPPPLLGPDERLGAVHRLGQPCRWAASLGGVLGAAIGIVPTLWIGAALHLASALPVLLSPLIRMRTSPAS